MQWKALFFLHLLLLARLFLHFRERKGAIVLDLLLCGLALSSERCLELLLDLSELTAGEVLAF